MASGAPSARTLMKSLTLHVVALALILMVPAGPLRRSAPLKEVDVVFHQPPPRVEVPVPVVQLPPTQEAAPGPPPKPKKAESPAPSYVPPEPTDSAPGEPLPPETPAPPGPEELAAAEQQRQEKIGKSGILAFRDQLASLKQDKTEPRLGVEARYTDAVEASQASRPLLTTTTPGSSGGINLASLSRKVGGGGGGRGGGGGVQVGRPSSPITRIGGGGGGPGGGGGAGGDRPGHGGPGPGRTDEEIQIVFDRYKAAFYRLYNRELRKDPSLQGQMVLRLTIEPDGSVSMCALQSSDMDAPDLASEVVNRVRTINFGAKEGVQALTIVYPIDFLPAT
ncbi:MAG: AgmX/PglI C-terminal domain-containing protein [Candidatus Polarisedimenticolia bacterium]